MYDTPNRYEIFHVLDFVDNDNVYVLLHICGNFLSPKIGHIERMPDFIFHTFTEDMKVICCQ